jgi:hypothetical protein
VEFAGTLADFLRVDMRRKYPELTQYVRVTLLQSAQTILTMFSAALQDYALSAFERTGVAVRTGVKVIGITSDKVQITGSSLPHISVITLFSGAFWVFFFWGRGEIGGASIFVSPPFLFVVMLWSDYILIVASFWGVAKRRRESCGE